MPLEPFHEPAGFCGKRRDGATWRRLAEICCVGSMETDALSSEPPAASKSSRTSTRTSSRSPRVELITRGEPRRRWSIEEKQAIAARSFEPGVSSTEVARAHGISSGLISTWRKALLAAQPSSTEAPTQFARVQIARPKQATPSLDLPVRLHPQLGPTSLIEIVLPDGTAVRVDAQIDPRALRRVLAAVRG
jgi:transposase